MGILFLFEASQPRQGVSVGPFQFLGVPCPASGCCWARCTPAKKGMSLVPAALQLVECFQSATPWNRRPPQRLRSMASIRCGGAEKPL